MTYASYRPFVKDLLNHVYLERYLTTTPVFSGNFKWAFVWGVLGWKLLKPKLRFHAAFFFFFFLHVSSKITVQGTKNTVHTLFTHCLCTVHESHDTIHTFKNYFTTVFSVFNFRNNKFNPNGPIYLAHKRWSAWDCWLLVLDAFLFY